MIRKPQWKKGNLVALDPGSHKAGLALFRDGKLIWAGPVINPKKTKGAQGWQEMAALVVRGTLHAWDVDTFVLERMQSYTDPRHQKGPQDDLLEVQGMSACLVGALAFRGKGPVELVDPVPATWKGQVPKEICHQRALEVLTAEEKKVICLKPAVAKLDTLDAVALGLWALRRT